MTTARYPRLLITGCARSGNTLLLHLIGTGYRNTRICYGERIPERSACRPGWSIVGKKPGAIVKLDRVLAEPDIGVIFTMRDPRDAICSCHYEHGLMVTGERWARCAQIVATHRDHPRVTVVHYEHVLRGPTDVQRWLAAKLGLQIRRDWVECWAEFDCRDSQGIAAMHGARPLDPARIGHWRDDPAKRQRVAEALESTAELPRWMQEFGYESQDSTAAVPVACAEA